MIIKANAVIKIRTSSKNAPAEIAKAVRDLLNKDVLPKVKSEAGDEISIRIGTDNLRVSK